MHTQPMLPRRKKLLSIAGLLASLAAAGPAFAGAAYVPFAAEVTVGGVRYETQVWASNRGSQDRRLETYFIASGTNGLERENAAYNGATVAAGATSQLTGLVPDGRIGLLEVSGAPQLAINARLVPESGQGGRLGTDLPVLSRENRLPAGSTVELQGLAREGQQTTSFALANLGQASAACTVSSFLANGNAIAAPVHISVKPLSLFHAADALAALGVQAATGVRLVVSCNQPFYTYALTFDPRNAAVNAIKPSELLTSTFTIPGGNVSCDPGAECFSRPGTFFVPTLGEPYRRETFRLPPGNYRKVHMRVEVQHNGWQQPSYGLHMLFWLARDRHFDLLGFAALMGPNRHGILFRHGIGQSATEKPRITKPFATFPGNLYVADYVWDAGNRSLVLRILDPAGNVLTTITDRTNVGRLHIAPGQSLTADFSFPAGHNPNEPPQYGWQYRNLWIEAFPE